MDYFVFLTGSGRGHTVVAGTQRPDGSFRKDRTIREGFVPIEAREKYLPPSRRGRGGPMSTSTPAPLPLPVEEEKKSTTRSSPAYTVQGKGVTSEEHAFPQVCQFLFHNIPDAVEVVSPLDSETAEDSPEERSNVIVDMDMVDNDWKLRTWNNADGTRHEEPSFSGNFTSTSRNGAETGAVRKPQKIPIAVAESPTSSPVQQKTRGSRLMETMLERKLNLNTTGTVDQEERDSIELWKRLIYKWK